MSFGIEYRCLSNTGRIREINQDNFYCNGEYMPAANNGTDDIVKGNVTNDTPSLFAVYDGIGGGARGEDAAYIAASASADADISVNPKEALVSLCLDANARICGFARENGIRLTGSTAAMVLAGRKKLHICNIGDSKILRIRYGKAEQLSKDHVAGLFGGGKGALTQHLGIPESEFLIVPHTRKCSYIAGDIFLICSDGITDMLSFDEICDIIGKNGRDTAAKELLSAALDRGGRDNITFILLYIDEQ